MRKWIALTHESHMLVQYVEDTQGVTTSEVVLGCVMADTGYLYKGAEWSRLPCAFDSVEEAKSAVTLLARIG